ncbi:MAG: branched-chain amino acid transporter AzlD [Clostridiales bacterium]|nr:branched-chain amino acid transporter AzlD [Clostridiales bacterium]
MSRTAYLLLAVLICAACTLLLRAVPFLLFRGRRDLPPAMRRLAVKLPPAIIAVLVVYCMKGLPGSDGGTAAATLIAAAVVVALHLWKRNTLVSIAAGTAVYMALLRMM